jgi:aryl-alcohol dehydrogenase-like predicted oxidoreductase
LSNDAITSVLVGVETVEQMLENLLLFEKGPLDPGLIEKIVESVPRFPESVVRPCLWNTGGMGSS